MSERVRCTCGAEHDCTSVTPRLRTVKAIAAQIEREREWDQKRAARDKNTNQRSEAARATHRKRCKGVVFLMKMSGMSNIDVGKALGIPLSRIGKIYENVLSEMNRAMDALTGVVPMNAWTCPGNSAHQAGVECVFCLKHLGLGRPWPRSGTYNSDY